MNDEHLAEGGVYQSGQPGDAATVYLPADVNEALGTPDSVHWFLDRETGLVYAVPPSEVGIRE